MIISFLADLNLLFISFCKVNIEKWHQITDTICLGISETIFTHFQGQIEKWR